MAGTPDADCHAARAEAARARRPRSEGREAAGGTERRRAAARRDRPCAGERSRADPGRRTDGQPRLDERRGDREPARSRWRPSTARPSSWSATIRRRSKSFRRSTRCATDGPRPRRRRGATSASRYEPLLGRWCSAVPRRRRFSRKASRPTSTSRRRGQGRRCTSPTRDPHRTSRSC